MLTCLLTCSHPTVSGVWSGCRVHHPSINRAVALVQKATEVLKVRAYNENEDDGQLRYIQVGGSRGREGQADQPADTLNLPVVSWHI